MPKPGATVRTWALGLAEKRASVGIEIMLLDPKYKAEMLPHRMEI